MTSYSIRPYKQSDRQAVRHICGETALYGQPIDSLLEDRELVVDALLDYYTEFEPESILVAEAEGKVVGYLAGCVDTRRFERIFMGRILPRLFARFVRRGHCFRPRYWRALKASSSSGARRYRCLRSVLDKYPAHCHMNIEAGFQRCGIGAAMFDSFLNYLASRNIAGMHISTTTEAGKAFFSRMGFELFMSYPAPGLPGTVSPGDAWLMVKSLAV